MGLARQEKATGHVPTFNHSEIENLGVPEGLPGTSQEEVPKVERNDAPSRLVRVLPGWSTPEHGIPMRTVIWSDISPN